MSDPQTALGPARAEGIATVEALPHRGMITLKGDLAAAGIKNAATGIAGTDMPGPLSCTMVDGRGIAWMAPDELLLFVPPEEVAQSLSAIETALAGAHATAVDMSDARAAFRVHGPHAREVLAKLSPVDFAPESFGPGTFRRTRLAQVPVAIWSEGAADFGVICFRSVAVYVFDILAGAAADGSAVGYFPAGS